MSDLTQLQRDIDWYKEGERDFDFLNQLVGQLLAAKTEEEAALRLSVRFINEDDLTEKPGCAVGAPRCAQCNRIKASLRARAEEDPTPDEATPSSSVSRPPPH